MVSVSLLVFIVLVAETREKMMELLQDTPHYTTRSGAVRNVRMTANDVSQDG